MLEPNMFEATDTSCADNTLNHVLDDLVYDPIRQGLDKLLEGCMLESLSSHVVDRRQETPMFYI